MEPAYQAPKVLRLLGISLKDYVPVEDVADARLLEGGVADPLDPAPESVHPLDKIPRVFTGLSDWPLHTNLCCWSCDFTFDDRPLFVPPYIREGENGRIECGVLGNMCTFNCAERYIEERLGGRASNEERWRLQDNLRLLYFLFTGRHTARIKPAPSKTELRKYGGDLDEDTFWRKMRELDPIAGLRNHTPGSVIPERDRALVAATVLRTKMGVSAPPAPRELSASDGPSAPRVSSGGSLAVGRGSVWGVCGLAPGGVASREDSVAIAGEDADPLAGALGRCLPHSSNHEVARPGSGPLAHARPDNVASAESDLAALLAEDDQGVTALLAALLAGGGSAITVAPAGALLGLEAPAPGELPETGEMTVSELDEFLGLADASADAPAGAPAGAPADAPAGAPAGAPADAPEVPPGPQDSDVGQAPVALPDSDVDLLLAELGAL